MHLTRYHCKYFPVITCLSWDRLAPGSQHCSIFSACLEKPSKGDYLFNAQHIHAINSEQINTIRNQKIGFVFQAFHLIERLTAIENVALPLMLAEVPAAKRKQQALHMLEKVGLADRANHYPNQLSGGQLQRIAIARALINQPQIVLADEPTGNLDQKNGIEIIELLESLNQEGITLVIITHDADIGQRAVRQLSMVDGQITEDKLATTKEH